jgi:hypothetical protein
MKTTKGAVMAKKSKSGVKAAKKRTVSRTGSKSTDVLVQCRIPATVAKKLRAKALTKGMSRAAFARSLLIRG